MTIVSVHALTLSRRRFRGLRLKVGRFVVRNRHWFIDNILRRFDVDRIGNGTLCGLETRRLGIGNSTLCGLRLGVIRIGCGLGTRGLASRNRQGRISNYKIRPGVQILSH
jgi:hypothetical protein